MIECTARERELFKKGYKGQYFNRLNLKRKNGEVISNENIVGESLKITERMCSGSTLKFGLCEAKSIEVDCFNIENIKGEKVEVTLEKVELESGEVKSTIPFGTYTVKSCKKQGLDGRRKIIGYDDLKSSTLDADISEAINESLTKNEAFKAHSIYQIEKDSLNKYGISKKEKGIEKIDWLTSTTSLNYFDSDTNQYFAAIHGRYLQYSFDSKEYYMFDIPMSLQTTRREKVDQFLKRYRLTFSGSDSFWLDQLCYLRLYDTDGNQKNYVGRNDGTEYTKVQSGTIFVTEKIEIRYGTGSSSQVWTKLDLGYEDVLEDAKVYKVKLSDMEKIILSKSVESITLRNIISSIYELRAEFGKMDRVTGLLEPVRLNRGGVTPQESLFPSESLFPYGGSSAANGESAEVWIDESGAERFGKIKLNYKTLGEDGKEIDTVYEYIFDQTVANTYEVKDNWILNNIIMSEGKIEQIAEEMSQNMRGINVYGFTAKMVGLPYLEVGDMIEIPNESAMTKVYILERTISGIQGLMDDMSALGGDG